MNELATKKAEWQTWRNHSDRAIKKAGQYVPWGKTPNYRLWQLSLNLSRFARQHYAVANQSYWRLFNSLKHEHDI